MKSVKIRRADEALSRSTVSSLGLPLTPVMWRGICGSRFPHAIRRSHSGKKSFKQIFYFEWSPPWHFNLKNWWHVFKHYFWHYFRHIFWDLTFFPTFFFGISSDILSSDILSDIISGMLTFYLAHLLTRGWGLAGNTAIRSWRLRAGGEHCRPELAVKVRRRTLRGGGGGRGGRGQGGRQMT